MGNFHPLSPCLLGVSPSDGRVHCKPTLSQKPSGSPSPCSKSSNTLLIANCCSDWLPHSCRTTPCPPWAPCSIASRPFPKPAGRIEQVFGRVQRADGSYMGCRRVAYGMVRVWSPLGSPCRQGKPNRLGSPHAVGGTCRRGAKTAFSNTLRGLGCSKNGFSYAVFDKGIHQPPLFGAPKRLFAGRIPPLPYPLPPCSRGERAGVRGDSSSPRCFGIFGSTRCTLIRPNGGKNRPHFRTLSLPLDKCPRNGA
jgi:hypothetical protein